MKLNKQFTAIAKFVTVSDLAKEMMNYKKSLAFIGLITSSTLALSSNPAQAFNFTTKTDLGTCSTLVDSFSPSGVDQSKLSNCKTADGFTLTPGPEGKQLQGKTVNKVNGVGVSGVVPSDTIDAVHGEVDYKESIKLTLPNPGDVLTSIGLSFLFQPKVFADQVYEAVKIKTDTGLEGILKITGNASATWSYLSNAVSSVTNISPSTGKGGGYYDITNPFGNARFDFLTLTPVTDGSVAFNSSANSDFALTHATATSVPEPTTLAGLGLVGGLLLATRRRKAIQS